MGIRMNIVFIVTSYWAYGELAIACEFAKRLERIGINPHFITPPSHQKSMQSWKFRFTTLFPKSRVLNVILFKDIEARLKPAAVILADFLNYNFCETHYGLTYEDLGIFSGRIGTFDDFDWSITKNQMDTYGFKARKFGEIDIRKYGFGLCPCPIVNPLEGKRDNTFHYRLIDRKLPYDIKKNMQYKRELNLPANRKMILLTNASWQDNYRKYKDVEQFVHGNQTIFWHMVEKLAKNNTILCIGKESYYKSHSDHIIFMDSVQPDLFDQYLLATDLYLSRNIASTSLARAVLSGIPSVCIQNSVQFNRTREAGNAKVPVYEDDFVNDQLGKLQRSYKYRMFPVGWFYFLHSVCLNNPYLKTFYQVEQYDIRQAEDIIYSLLEGEEVYRNLLDRLAEYEHILAGLPDIHEIVGQILERR